MLCTQNLKEIIDPRKIQVLIILKALKLNKLHNKVKNYIKNKKQ